MKQTFRALARRPGFALVGIVTIALAIAGNAAIFSILKAVLLDPLPWRDAGELVTIDVKSTRGFYVSTSIPNYRDWRDRTRSFQQYGGEAGWGFILTGRGQAEVVSARAVIGDLFPLLGLEPQLGRLFGAAETELGSEPIVVLGSRYWTTRFGANPAILGQALVLDGRPHTVVGVLRPDAGYPNADVNLYVPMGSIPDLPWEDRGSSFGTRIVARLAPGVTAAAALEDLNQATRAVVEQEGRDIATPEVRSLTTYFVGDVDTQIWILMGAVGFVLLIAVANMGNLTLARAEDRRREIAVRTALGAGRKALIRALLSESVMLSIAGGTVGLVLSLGAVRLALPLLPDTVPAALRERIGIDVGVAAFAFVVAALAGALAGLVPALRLSDPDLAQDLREGSRGTGGAGRQRLRAGLVVTEVALALVLLIGASLMLQSLRNLRSADKGFNDEGVLTVRVPLADDRYGTRERRLGFYQELLTRAEALPGVQSAAMALLLPLSQRSWELGVLPDNMPYDREQQQSVLFNVVSPSYFETMGVSLLDGSVFTGAERDETELVAVIDETMAAKFWPGERAVGKRITIDLAEGSTDDRPIPLYRTVIGVVKNVRHYDLSTPSRIQVYVPMGQPLARWGATLNLILRAGVPPMALLPIVAREIEAMDPAVPPSGARPLSEYVAGDLSTSRAMGAVLGVFGALALVLSAVGIFGVMSYMVLRRTKEIGIRVALGAAPAQVAAWVARYGVRLAAVGIAAGLLGAAVLTRVLRGLLYEVGPLDPVLYALLSVVLLGVAALATYLPARRAARVDPVTALSQEG